MPEVLLTSRMVSKKGTSLAGEDSGRPGRNLSVVRDLRIFYRSDHREKSTGGERGRSVRLDYHAGESGLV